MISNSMKSGKALVLIMLSCLVFGGCDKQEGGITILAQPGLSNSPSHLDYSTMSAVYTLNEPITDNMPSVTGIVTEWSVEPELPAGLTIDQQTGIISGMPTVLQTAVDYTVTAGGYFGSTAAVISIAVNSDPPSAL